jgi:excisionase family DNA binding protein
MGEAILEQLLTAEELAGLLKIKAKTLLHWAGHGRIPSYKINGVRRFKLSEISRWLDEERLREQEGSQRSSAMVSELRFLKTRNNRLRGNQRGTKGTL